MSHHSTPSNNIQLSVIVLFYYGERWIQECIQSLQEQSLARSTYEIILVDNGGSTPSVKKYEGLPHTKVLRFPKNYGFAGGNNKALAHADGEFILLMNQDAVVHFNCLEELLNALTDNPRAGVISANMLMISANTHIDRQAPVDDTVGLYELTPFGYAAYTKRQVDCHLVPVDFISGNAMCFRKRMLDDAGCYLFDERLVSYAEDLDLSIRLKKTAWKMYVRPKARVFHYRDEAFSGNPMNKLRKLVHISSNRLWVYYNNLNAAHFLRRLPALSLGIPLKVARPDGSIDFHLSHFLMAAAALPLVFTAFGVRVFTYRGSKPKHRTPQI
jgi:GT2 family glycosyltransferase